MVQPKPSPIKAKCPVCSGAEIHVLEDPAKLFGRYYKCAACGASLKAKYSLRRGLRAIALCIGSMAVSIGALYLLFESHLLQGFWLAAAKGALLAASFSVSMGFAMRGFEYHTIPDPLAPSRGDRPA
jgi:hypothetical protein